MWKDRQVEFGFFARNTRRVLNLGNGNIQIILFVQYFVYFGLALATKSRLFNCAPVDYSNFTCGLLDSRCPTAATH
jgi:hypothetical protein